MPQPSVGTNTINNIICRRQQPLAKCEICLTPPSFICINCVDCKYRTGTIAPTVA